MMVCIPCGVAIVVGALEGMNFAVGLDSCSTGVVGNEYGFD
jgi:hypothetical protein